jgi:hypothetical protein
MAEDIQMQHGGCECGGVRFRISGALRPVVFCHCGQCLRTHGHAAAYTDTTRSALAFEADETLKWYASSDQAKRGFCGHCGASLFFAVNGAEKICVAAGMLQTPTALHTAGHIFTADKSDYYEITDGLPNFSGNWQGPDLGGA